MTSGAWTLGLKAKSRLTNIPTMQEAMATVDAHTQRQSRC
jgi:hypothetical protein